MYTRSNFLRVSVFVVISALAILSILGGSGSNVAAQDPTATPTDVVTDMPTATDVVTDVPTATATDGATDMPTATVAPGDTGGGTGGTGGDAATPTMVATVDESDAFPPCPEVEVATMEATDATDADATMETTMDMTMEATVDADLTATADTGTPEATPMVGEFEEQEGCVFTADLTGEAEKPNPGDPDGEGKAVVTLSRPADGGFGMVCFEIEVSNITLPAVAAHIHRGTPDVAGPVVVPLSAPDAEGIARGCTTNVNRGTIRLIVTNPSEFYVNVHTSDFPQGAVRGQLEPEEEEGS